MPHQQQGQLKLEIPLSDLTYVHQLPEHVRQRWAAWDATEPAAEDMEMRLAAAAKRREDFQHWMTEKAKQRRREGDSEQDKIQVLKRLEEKLAAAQLNREKELEAVRTRAASLAAPRNEAVASRMEQRAEEVAQRLQQNLEAAERRRQARMDAARERLNAAHELVVARLAKTLEQEKRCNSEKRRRIHSRLRKADEARREQLAAVAGKAGEVVERARQVSRTARLTAERDARRRKSQLSSRLDAAAERRRQRGISSTGSDPDGSMQLGDVEQQQLEEIAASLSQESSREQLAAAHSQAGKVVGRPQHATPEPDAKARKSQLSSRLDAAAERRHQWAISGTVADAESGLPLGDVEQQRLQELAASLRARHLQKTWRNFMRKRKTTAALAAAFAATGVPSVREDGTRSEAAAGGGAPDELQVVEEHAGGVVMIGGMSNGQSPRHAEFENFAERLQGAATLRASLALLRRLEMRLNAQGVADASATALLKRLYPRAPRNSQPERYPPRVFLCAYMILQHPEVVFSSLGKQEMQLSQAAQEMVDAFENLLERILRPLPSPLATPMSSPRQMPAAALCPSPLKAGMQAYRDAMKQGDVALAASHSAAPWTRVGEMLVQFDEAWLGYLDQFVAWKSHDAESLVSELVRMGAQLELSLRRKLAGSAERLRSSTDLQAMVAQVAHDHQLLRERIEKLAGKAGVDRLEAALRAARDQVASESESEWETDRSNPPSRRTSTTGSLPASTGASTSQEAGAACAQPAAAQPAAAAAPPPQVSTNEQLVWELLYNPAYRLPSTEADTTWQRALAEPTSPGTVQQPEAALDPSELANLTPQELTEALTRQAVGIAERAFWDAVAQSLAAALRDGDLAHVLGPMVAELGADLAAAMPEGAAADNLRGQFAEVLVMQQLRNGSAGGGNSLLRCMEMLQQLSHVLISSGAVAREADATRAQAKVAEALQAAAGASGADADARVVQGLVAALRLLFAQLKLLKLDLANARLAMLAASIQGAGAAGYLRTKFAAAHQLPDADSAAAAALAAKLPRSAAWLAQAQGGLPMVEQRLQSMAVTQELLEAAPAGFQQPLPAMRSGARGPVRASQASDAAAAPAAVALKAMYPVRLRSWQGVVRWAVLGLAVQDTSALEGLPEVLEGQAPRLHAAQNQVQALLVATAALLITQQVRQRNGRAAWTAAEQRAAKARVLGVLRQPDMQLEVLVALLAQLAGVATPEEEGQIRGAFRTLVSSGSGAYRAISGSLSGVLLVHLLLGSSQLAANQEVSRAVSAALARSGATPFAEELASLAAELALVSAAVEAVHGPVLSALLQQ